MQDSRLPSPSGRTRMRSHRPLSPLRALTRTSSWARRPSRAALSSRYAASETAASPMKTRSTGRTSRGPDASMSSRYAALAHTTRHAAPARVRHQDALAGMVDDCREQRTLGRPARDAQDSGGERKQQERAEDGQDAAAAAHL